jgi:diacylglycerol kinase (ATP)
MDERSSAKGLKSRGGATRIGKAFGYSMAGFRSAFRHEAAFRQELLLVAVLAPCAFWLGEGALQVALLLATLLGILVVELVNSAIEALADAVSPDLHPLIGRAKDIGSAAVLLAITAAAIIWGGILVARLGWA